VIVQKRGGALLFGTAALVLAAAAFLYVVLQPLRTRYLAGEFSLGGKKPAAAAAKPAPATSSPAATTSEPPAASAPPAPTITAPASASPAVGEPRPNAKASVSKDTARSSSSAKTAPETPAAAVPRPAPDASAQADHVYRTRGAMKFQISPDQARLFIDGIYVGVADDWDDHGGGKPFPFSSGTHAVHAKLPGYKDLNLQIVVDASAPKEVESSSDDMTRLSKDAYQKVAKVDYATTSGVLFSPKFGAADITLDEKPAGTAAQYTASAPLKLSGPMVHEIVIRRVARPDKIVRVLCATTAGKDNVEIKE